MDKWALEEAPSGNGTVDKWALEEAPSGKAGRSQTIEFKVTIFSARFAWVWCTGAKLHNAKGPCLSHVGKSKGRDRASCINRSTERDNCSKIIPMH